MFRTLFEEGINIEMITTSEIRITCIIDEDAGGQDAVRALHKAFRAGAGAVGPNEASEEGCRLGTPLAFVLAFASGARRLRTTPGRPRAGRR